MKENQFRLTFKLNGKIVAPRSSNVTLLSKIVPNIYAEELFVYSGPGTPDIDFFPGKIKNLLIKTKLTLNTTTTTTTAAVVTAAVKNKVNQRDCITQPETTMMANNLLVNDQEHDDLPSVDLFLNPNRANELDQIKKTTIERANDYFTSVDMGKVYPALFRLLWPSTLLCQKMISACSLAGTPRNCSLLFKRSS